MPVVTRSQSKNVVAANPKPATISPRDFHIPSYTEKELFINQLAHLLLQCASSKGKENKMNVASTIFEKVDRELPDRIAVEGLDHWIQFICIVYSKTTEFIREKDEGVYKEIDQNIQNNFFRRLFQTRNFTSDIIKNYRGSLLGVFSDIRKAKEEITKSYSAGRPHRNISRVNYAGMSR